jgi:TonB family protein
MSHLGPSLRRARVRERPARRAAAALLASILLNSLAFLLLVRAGAFRIDAPPARVSLAPVSAARWAANRAIAPGTARPPPAAPAAPAKPAPDPEREARGQVVDVAPSPSSTPPRNSRFLSDRANSVEKETRARSRQLGERVLAYPSAPGVQAPPPPGQGGRSDRAAPGAEGRPGEERQAAAMPKVAVAPAAPGQDGDRGPALAPAPAPGAGPPAEGEGGERRSGAPGDRSLITPGTLARIAGGPGPDRLDGVEEGDGTFLNTRSWKYATYFNRIKQAVAAAWDPLTPLDARDPDRSMFGYKDRFTLLGVTLDDAGRVKSLVVEQTSGADFLDRAALSAFQSAQPFVNPPRGLADGNGEIRFSFGFFLEVGRQGLRVYRAPLPALP